MIIRQLLLIAVLATQMVVAMATELVGAGATFPYPFYAKVFDAYTKEKGIKVNYQPIGSGGGIRQLINQTIAFGATDAFLNEAELKEASRAGGGRPVIHIPTTIGAVAITYNIPGLAKGNVLNLDGELLSQIFQGKIAKWNDARIAKINPQIKLPPLAILVVHRSDGSGTTHIFSEYLGASSSDWKSRVGVGKSLNWPAGIGAKGNAGLAKVMKSTPGAIGYLEHNYAIENGLSYAAIKSSAAENRYILPTLPSIALAANRTIPNDMRIALTSSPAIGSYPLASFTWIILYQDLKVNLPDRATAAQLITLLRYLLNEGQEYAHALHYARLPSDLTARLEKILQTVTFDGKKL